jgi:rubrerythrin
MNVQRLYDYALQREREGRSFFETNANRMSHAAAVVIFHRLAAEEQKHIEFTEKLLGGLLDGESGVGLAIEPEPEDRFSQRAESEMLDQTVIESMTPDVAILRMAYRIERDFAEFYEMAADKAEGDARLALRTLARWERGHEQLFNELHDRALKEYAQMPWGG